MLSVEYSFIHYKFWYLQKLILHIFPCLKLTDGRKSVGGKLEVKVRIRDPFKNKQVEEVKEKWLVIDQFIKTLDNPQPAVSRHLVFTIYFSFTVTEAL